MGALSARVKRLYESLRTSREHLEAEDEERSASRRGTDPIGSLTSRQRTRVSGVLQAVTYRSSQDKPILVGQLYDGTGSIDLVWWGRGPTSSLRGGSPTAPTASRSTTPPIACWGRGSSNRQPSAGRTIE